MPAAERNSSISRITKRRLVPHVTRSRENQSGIGNSLAGLAEIAGSRVGGQSAEEYLYWSVLRPGRYLVASYSNIMFADYEERLEALDLADLIAYLLTLD